MGKVRLFLAKSIRVWHILKKPSSREFKLVAKISALGVLVIGLIGFLIAILMDVFK